MAKLVAVGELVIGICLILGLFAGSFAFLGVVLNFSFVFSGSAGVNPAIIIVGLLLVQVATDRAAVEAMGRVHAGAGPPARRGRPGRPRDLRAATSSTRPPGVLGALLRFPTA